MEFKYCKSSQKFYKEIQPFSNSFVNQPTISIMDTTNNTPENNENVDGYKVPGDGNVPNSLAAPGNESFEENPNSVIHKKEEDIPGKEFNTGDKAFADSSKENFVKTASALHYGNDAEVHVDLHYKKPDGDR